MKRPRFEDYRDQQMRLFESAELDRETPRASLEAYFRMLCDNPQVLRMMWWMLLEKDHRASENVEALREVAVSRIAAAQAAGVVRSDLPASFVLVTFLGLAHAAGSPSEPSSRPRRTRPTRISRPPGRSSPTA